jgi:protein TonB
MRPMTRRGLQIAGALTIALTTAAAVPNAWAGDSISDWKTDVVKLVARKQVYPRAALSREIEGTAKVQLTIDRTGHVTSYDVVQPTGHPELDEDIPKLVKRIDPLPQPPSELADKDLTLTLPLNWVIQ